MRRKSSKATHRMKSAASEVVFLRLLPLFAGFFAFFLISIAGTVRCQEPKKLDERSFSHALARRGCTQEDAPALEIFFTPGRFSATEDPVPPYLRFEISSSPDERLRAVSLELMPLRRDPTKPGRIARGELVSSIRNAVWLTGTISLDEAEPGGYVQGSYIVSTPKGQHFKNSFRTEYVRRSIGCG